MASLLCRAANGVCRMLARRSRHGCVSLVIPLQGTVPIPGAKDLKQAKENLGALGWRLGCATVT
jgi:hypothetical protein